MLIKFVYNQRKEVREKERERYFTERNRKIEGYFDERERERLYPEEGEREGWGRKIIMQFRNIIHGNQNSFRYTTNSSIYMQHIKKRHFGTIIVSGRNNSCSPSTVVNKV